jgi:TonB-linked SusC/RagA family outer membrane protein
MRFLIPFAGLLVAATAPVGSQQAAAASPLDRTVTLTLEGVPLKDALDAVARQSGVRIAYSGRVVPLTRPVSVQLAAVRVEAALDALLHGTGVASTLDGTGQILLVTDRATGRAAPQSGSISGTVRDSTTGAPLGDAVVTVVGTAFTARTGADGRFVITGLPAGSYRVRVRMLGYSSVVASVTVQDGEQAVADVQLARSAIELNPVVAIGYGTVEKRDLTGAVSSVTADQFETKAAPTVTLTAGLQGKVAGVQVTSNSGMPGVGIQVRVRGTGSITANTEPLYVIDGLPAEQGSNDTDPKNNPLMSLDPNEIESIDILKDASATAIYGARGANGVVLITTKRGQPGTSQFTVESSVGFQNIAKTIPVLNAPQFMRLTNAAILNAGGDSTKPGYFHAAQIASAVTYDYPAMMLRTGFQANQGVSLSGGDQKLRYLISGNFTRQEGIEIGSDFNRYGVRVNLDGEATSRFRWGSSLSMTRTARNAARVENGSLGNSANGIQAAMQFAPFQAPKDSAGNWIKTSPSTEPVPNPIANALEETDLNTTSRFLGSVFGELALTPSLKLKGTLGGNFQFDGIHFFAPRTILDGGNSGSGWLYTSQGRNLTSENTITYARPLGPGNLDLLGGFSVQTWYDESVTATAAGFPTDFTNVYNLGSGSQLYPPSSGVTEHALISYLGRANYNLADKYLFTVTGRRDGSSVFGANHKWGFFPSAAFAWRVGDESFMQHQSLFNDLKLRLSYGAVGNQAVDPYQSLSQLSVGWVASGTTEIPAMTLGTLMPNPDLHWEQKTEFNAGLDANMLRNRVAFTIDAYRSKTKDLLLRVTVPATTGYNQQLQNVGSVQNNGVELSVTTVNIARPTLNWRSTLTVAHNSNKVLDLGTRPDSAGNPVPVLQLAAFSPRTGNFFSPSDVYLVQVGQSLGTIYGYQVTGLWQTSDTGAACYLTNKLDCTPGEYKIADLAGGGPKGDKPDGKITSADRTILGHSEPTFFGGLSNTVTWGRLSLDALFNFVYGNKVINAGTAYGCLDIMQANERACVLDHWDSTHTNTMVPRPNRNRPRSLYSTFVEDGSYLRLQTLTLGYELPPGLLFGGAASARVYVTGQNLFTLTGYSGFDPDVNSQGGDPRFGLIDIGAYPRSRVWNVGVRATF